MSFEQPIISNFDERKPYIFISYAHVDSERVYPIISKLQQDGFRVWYDDGIGPGSEWPNTIAAYLKKSTFFLAFLSKAYFKSGNCLDELNQARDLKDTSKCLLIYIEPAEMDDGTRLRFSRVQAIEWYRFDAGRCYSKLYGTQDFAKCNVSGRVPQIAVTSAAQQTGGGNGGTGSKNPQTPQWPVGGGGRTGGNSRRDWKKTVIIAAVVIGVLVIGNIVRGLMVAPALQKIASSNASDESGVMDESYGEDAYLEDDVNSDDINDSSDTGNSGSDTAPDKEDAASSKDRVKLTSIEEPVEQIGFEIKQDVTNTMGTTYDEAVKISDACRAYVRYNVGEFNRFVGTYSIDSENNPSGKESKLLVYLDENEDAPCIDTKVSRSTVETPIDIDVSSAQFITFVIDEGGSYTGCSLLLTDCYLSKESSLAAAETEVKSTGTSISAEKSTVKLTSIENPVEQIGFEIKQDVTNTMGTTYDEAVKISDACRAYVRYNVGEFNRFIGTYSIDSENNPPGKESKLLVYLDENEDAPCIDTKVSRSTVETPIDIDVSSAQFITFVIDEGGSYTGCSLLLTDCTLNK